jgi:L-lactate dehydrogenase complex protein LldG
MGPGARWDGAMNDPRATILQDLRANLGRQGKDSAALKAVHTRLQRHQRGTIPARSKGDRATLVRLFERQAVAAEATIFHVRHDSEIPQAVAEFLAQENLPASLRIAPDERLMGIDWASRPTLSTSFGATDGSDAVALVRAFSGIAETGTLMLHSGKQSPTTLNFLPDTHIVLLDSGRIVGAYEEAWDNLRTAGAMPRTVNFVTGPSRTADIEQTLLMGAHGPRRLHIIMRNDGT